MKALLASVLLAPAFIVAACGEASIPVESAIDASKRSKPEIEIPEGPAPRELVVNDLIMGSGKPAKRGQDVVIEYRGVRYRSGEEYANSWEWEIPSLFEMSTREMIVGWVRGIEGMRVGGRRELIIPQSLLSVEEGPPGPEAVVFVMDLLDVSPAS